MFGDLLVQAKIKRVSKSSFGQHVAIIASGTAIAQAIPILLTPILTRLYSPNDMGMLGLYTAFISFLANALSLGYSQAIVTGRTDDEGEALAALSCLIVMPMSIGGALLLALFSTMGWLGFGELPLWTSIAMALSLGLTGVFFSLRYWLVRIGAYRIISTATVAQSIGRVATQIIAGVLGMQWVGLVLGEVIGRASGLGRFWNATSDDVRSRIRHPDAPALRGVAILYRKFPLFTAPSSLLNSLSLVLPVPLIAMYFGIQPAGQFAIASRVMLLPLSLIGGSVGDVFHSRIADLSRRAPERAQQLFLSVVGVLFAVGLAPALIVGTWGDTLFPRVLGSSWREAGVLAAAIVPWVLAQFVVSPVSRLVQVYQGQELKLIYDILALTSIAGVLSYGAYQGWSLAATCTLLGWSQAGVYGVYLLLLLRILRKYTHVNVTGDDRDVA